MIEPSAHRPEAPRLELRVEKLGVDRGGRRILRDVSFSLASGSALLVTGRNGAGKSTLLRAIIGLLPRVAGEATLVGGVADQELAQQAHYLSHADGLKAALTVEENLSFWASYLGGAGRSPRAALEAVGLAHVAAAPAGALSAGQKRRVALARLLVAHRPLWLLDEPLTALDAASRARFAALLQDHLRAGGLVLAATHEPLGLDATRELKLGSAA